MFIVKFVSQRDNMFHEWLFDTLKEAQFASKILQKRCVDVKISSYGPKHKSKKRYQYYVKSHIRYREVESFRNANPKISISLDNPIKSISTKTNRKLKRRKSNEIEQVISYYEKRAKFCIPLFTNKL